MKQIELVLATKDDVTNIHELQYRAFLPLYEKYHDDETNPVKETIARTKEKVTEETSEFYLIQVDGKDVGGVRVARKKYKNDSSQYEYVDDVNFISPIFILPEFQNQGIGQKVIYQLFEKYSNTVEWVLYTIKQEKANCHLYEKCGFKKVGEEMVITDKMSLIRYEKNQ